MPLAHLSVLIYHAEVRSFSTFPTLVSFYYPESHRARDQKQIALSIMFVYRVHLLARPCLS